MGPLSQGYGIFFVIQYTIESHLSLIINISSMNQKNSGTFDVPTLAGGYQCCVSKFILHELRSMNNEQKYGSGHTVPPRKRGHGRCTLHWAKTGTWADIPGINIAFRYERAPR